MWLENLNDLTKKSGLTNKQIADRALISEKTVERIRAGKVKTPYLDTLDKWCKAIGVTLNDVLADTMVVVGNEKLATLQENMDVANAELDIIKAENKVLNDKVAALTAENDLLRLKLDHKDEIIRLHNYYGALLSKKTDSDAKGDI